MTPSNRVGNIPDEVLVHELGHLVVGLKLGFPEAGIEFTENHPSEKARAHYNRPDVPPGQVVMRALAGMYSQALHAPESLDEKLRAPITSGGLFTDAAVLDPDSPTTAAMVSNGFEGDWQRILGEAAMGSPNRPDQLAMLRDAHERLLKLFDPDELRRVVFLLRDDIAAWLRTDDEDIEFAPLVMYSASRAKALCKGAF